MLPGTKIVGFTTFDEEFHRSLLTATSFDMILSARGIREPGRAIHALLPANDPLDS